MRLSVREIEVLQLLAHEATSKEISETLFISNHTTKSHRKNLLGKLRAKNTAGLIRRGFELGYLQVNT